MRCDITDPGELVFWRKRLTDGTLLSAIKTHPNEAKRIFGLEAVMQGNLLKLSFILGARELLALPEGMIASEPNVPGEHELFSLLSELPDEHRIVAGEFMSAKNQEARVREVAKSIIRRAMEH